MTGDAISRLAEGNGKYAGKADKKLLSTLVKDGQHPYAMVITCADSRVPPELIFDAKKPGSIFVARNAGNVATYDVIGTAEYAVGHLGVKTIVVLGHSNCGAVTGAMKGGHAHGALGKLLAHIEPAAERAGGDLNRAIELNVKNQITELMHESDAIKRAVAEGELEIVGMIYELETGKVRRI